MHSELLFPPLPLSFAPIVLGQLGAHHVHVSFLPLESQFRAFETTDQQSTINNDNINHRYRERNDTVIESTPIASFGGIPSMLPLIRGAILSLSDHQHAHAHARAAHLNPHHNHHNYQLHHRRQSYSPRVRSLNNCPLQSDEIFYRTISKNTRRYPSISPVIGNTLYLLGGT